MADTKIAWTDKSWNPVVGCSKVSAGCDNCYAEKMAHRVRGMMYVQSSDKSLETWEKYDEVLTMNGKWNGHTYCDESALDKPLHWKTPCRIFVCSMGDLFHESVPFEFIDKVMKIIDHTHRHIFQVLTKRPERMKKYMLGKVQARKIVKGIASHTAGCKTAPDFPPNNLWLGVTAENQEMADKRIPILLQIPAAVRFVSIEPMLGEVNLGNICSTRNGDSDLGWGGKKGGYPYLNCLTGREYSVLVGQESDNKLDWVIVGAESGPKRRYCKHQWALSIVKQCKAAGVPCFVKQLQENDSGKNRIVSLPPGWPRDYPEAKP